MLKVGDTVLLLRMVNFSRVGDRAGVELGRVCALDTISTDGIIGTIYGEVPDRRTL